MAAPDRTRRLAGKVAIVTGGATGIGEAVALVFAQEGAKVVVAGLPGDPTGDVVDEIREITGGDGLAAPFNGDLADEHNARACVQLAITRFERLDILANVAGIFQTTANVEDFPLEDYEFMMRCNCTATFLMTKHAMEHLKRSRGVLLGTASEAGPMGQPRCAPYGGSKNWMIGFIRSVALEGAPFGVRANIVCPGPTMTGWHDTAVSSMTEDMERDIQRSVPLGRHASPEEIARVFAFLASDDASFVTGAAYFADGGISIARATPGDKVPDDLRRPPPDTVPLRNQMRGMENIRTRSL